MEMYDFNTVVDFFDGMSGMARTLRVKPQAVWQWKQGFPELRTYQIEVLSRRHFRANRLPIRAEKASAKGSSSRGASTD
jgi:hypothetical protein